MTYETPAEAARKRLRELYRASAPNAESHLARSAERYDCCWEPKADAHHPLCRNFEEPPLPEVSPDQESLL